MTIQPRNNPLLDSTDSISMPGGNTQTRLELDRCSAAGLVTEIRPGMDLYAVARGQFSLVDMIATVLRHVGTADLDIVTWALSASDALRVCHMPYRRCRWVVDKTFRKRHRHEVELLREKFGVENVAVTSTHAKLILFGNEQFSVSLMTSANLTMNRRIEFYLLRESRDLYAFNREWIDELFK